MFAYEKGLIWGNDNYRTNAALVNVALATGNVGREGGGCVRMGGHQEGYVRPSDAHVGRPAAYVDKLLIEGKGGVHHIWACDHYKTTLNAHQFNMVYKKRTDIVKDAMNAVPYGDRDGDGEGDHRRDQGRRPVLGRRRHHPLEDRRGQPCLAAGRRVRRDEPDLHERRTPHAARRALHGPARQRQARLPDRRRPCPAHGKGAARNGRQRLCRPVQGLRLDRPRKTPSWTATTRTPVAASTSPTSGFAPWATTASRNRRPAFEDGKIVGTKRLYTDGKFGTKDGKATFMEAVWRGLQAPGKEEQKENNKYLINNGRANLVWQNAFLDQDSEFVMDRWPYPFIEMNPDDMAELGVKKGDLVEVYNESGSTQAMVYPTPTAKKGETFMLFAYPDRRAGQRHQCRHERADPAELQADLGEHPEDLGCAGGREAPVVQVAGIYGGLMPILPMLRRGQKLRRNVRVNRLQRDEWRDDGAQHATVHCSSPLSRAKLARPARTAGSFRSTSRQPRRSPLREPSKETERVPLLEAAGRVLARDVLAPIDLPPFDNSAMDGYAVRLRRSRRRRTMAASACRHGSPQATRMPRSARPAKVALRIFTGAPVPPGFDAVVMQEHCERAGDASSSSEAPARGREHQARRRGRAHGNAASWRRAIS